jgi:hypothetical protein
MIGRLERTVIKPPIFVADGKLDGRDQPSAALHQRHLPGLGGGRKGGREGGREGGRDGGKVGG